VASETTTPIARSTNSATVAETSQNPRRSPSVCELSLSATGGHTQDILTTRENLQEPQHGILRTARNRREPAILPLASETYAARRTAGRIRMAKGLQRFANPSY
jgi:hypothetical protein